MSIRFSIITPSFNQLDWLRLCIASVRDQVPHPNSHSAIIPPPSAVGAQRPVSIFLEHIIQDAGTPGIEDLAREVGAEFHRNGQLVFEATPSALRYSPSALGPNVVLKIFSEPDAGMYDAVNKGIKKATGDILAYLNCDEQYLVGSLQRVAEFFEKDQKVDIFTGGVLVVDCNGNLISARPGIKPWLWHIYTDHLPLFTAGLFWRRHVTQAAWAKFDGRLRDCADAMWIIDRLRDGSKIKRITLFLASFTDTGDNMNLKPNARAEGRFIFTIAPFFAKKLSRIIVLGHRTRKLLMGCYFLKEISYSIYTNEQKKERKKFKNISPRGKWNRVIN